MTKYVQNDLLWEHFYIKKFQVTSAYQRQITALLSTNVMIMLSQGKVCTVVVDQLVRHLSNSHEFKGWLSKV